MIFIKNNKYYYTSFLFIEKTKDLTIIKNLIVNRINFNILWEC